MSLSAATIDALVASGATAEILAAYVKAELAVMEAAQAEQRRRATEKKRRQRALSPSVPGTSGDIEGQAGTAGDNPLSLPSSPQTPQLPTHTPGDINTHARKRAAKRVPESWTPSMAVMEFAVTEGFLSGEIERELATMRDHTFATARSDWDATFRNWLRRKKPNQSPRATHERRNENPGLERSSTNLERAFAGAEIASRLRAEQSSGGF